MPDDGPVNASGYRRAALGTKALQRLGARLASREALTADEEDLYQRFIVDADERRISVQEFTDGTLGLISDAIPRTGVKSTGRTKTRSTLVDKLRRDPTTKLPSIRDVAGVRVVADCSTLELRLAVAAFRGLIDEGGQLRDWGFTGETRLIDRIATPAWGYRAFHIEVRLDGAPAEIQFRTQLQHEWAELMELLCDRWGREARYGLPIVESHPDIRRGKQIILDRVQDLSSTIGAVEAATERVGMGFINRDVVQASEKGWPAGVEEYYDGLREIAEPVVADLRSSMRESIRQIQEVFVQLETIAVEQGAS